MKGRIEVDIHLTVQFRSRDIREVCHEAGACIVDQSIDATNPHGESFKNPGHRCGIGQIRRHGKKCRPMLVRHALQASPVKVDARNLKPFLQKPCHDCTTHPPSRARHHSDLHSIPFHNAQAAKRFVPFVISIANHDMNTSSRRSRESYLFLVRRRLMA